MKNPGAETEATPPPDLELAGACLACGGALSIRIRPRSTWSVCRGCGWWSHPTLSPAENGLYLRHPSTAEA